jgi:hypothetical protein
MSASCAHDVHISPHNTVRAILELPEHVIEGSGDVQPKLILGLQAGSAVTKGSRSPKPSIPPDALHSMDKHRAAFSAANKEEGRGRLQRTGMDKIHWIKQRHGARAALRSAPGNNFVPVAAEVPKDITAARALTHIQDRCELPARSIDLLMGRRMRAGCSFWPTCMCTRVPVSARDVLTGPDGNVVEKAGVAAAHAFRGLSMCSTALCPSTPW